MQVFHGKRALPVQSEVVRVDDIFSGRETAVVVHGVLQTEVLHESSDDLGLVVVSPAQLLSVTLIPDASSTPPSLPSFLHSRVFRKVMTTVFQEERSARGA